MTTKRKGTTKSAAARKPKSAANLGAIDALSIGTNVQKTAKERVAALAEAPLSVCDNDQNLQSMLNLLRNKEEPIGVRLAALQSLQAASFSVVAFESCRGDYTAALREVAQDPDAELRQRALGLLAREKDGLAQKLLLDGLHNPEKALVPPEKALQLLGYDVHAEAYPIARAIISNPPNPSAKREAYRLLAADATAAPLFEKALRDKGESLEIRQIAASALHSLQPEKLQANAREMLLDAKEQDDMKASSLTALTQFGDAAAIGKDKALMKRVQRLSSETGNIKQTALQFLGKYTV